MENRNGFQSFSTFVVFAGMKKSKRVLVLLVVLVMMTFALAPTVAFAAPAPLTVELSEGIILKAQTPDEDSRFYYTTSASSQAAPVDDDPR